MDAPGIVEDALEDETVATDVDLGGDDHLYVTPTRTLIYRSEGILSDESVEEYGHEAERLSVSEGRRKATVTLTYPIDGTEEFTVPAASLDEAIPAILAGVLNANGVLEPGESVLETFRFSELTLVVTSERLVKHIGGAVWDVEYEEFRYEDVTGLSEEAGSVATQLVLDVGGRTERIKTPNDRAPEVVRRLEDALRAYHDLGEHEDVGAALSTGESDDADGGSGGDPGGTMTFEDGVDPLDAGDTTSASVDGLEELGDDAGAGSGGSTGGSGGSAGGASSGSAGSGGTAGSSGTGGATASGDGGTEAASASAASAGGVATDDASEASAGSSDVDSADRDGGSDAASAAGESSADAGGSAAEAGDDAGDEEPDDADAFEEAGFESAGASPDLEAQLEELRDAVEQQNELLARQQETIEQLVEELRREL